MNFHQLIKYNMKIAAALIVRGDDKEAEALDRCLKSITPHVDGIFITITNKPGEETNERTLEVALEHGATVSRFEWVNDFSAARNFNFSQVPKEYDYIIWCDADDVWRGLDKLETVIKDNPKVDAFAFWYLYEFDEYKQPTVSHKKTQVVKNDGCVEWAGALHEDFKENRSVSTFFVEGIERIHLTNEERIKVAAVRNEEVSRIAYENNPQDPRHHWNYASSLFGVGKFAEANKVLAEFLDKSGSDEERYIALLRLADCERGLNNETGAIDRLRYAIGLRPSYPDAYNELGKIMFNRRKFDDAEQLILTALRLKPPYNTIIVMNPREYDFNPMMLLAKIYYHKSRPDLACIMLEGCLKLSPKHQVAKDMLREMKAVKNELSKILTIIQKLQRITDKDKLIKALTKVPKKYQSHPGICAIRNGVIVKETSTGKDVVYCCGYTTFEWNPQLFKTKGFGGSEEAVINLSREWAKMGWNVTVYNNCGPEEIAEDGVTYKPFWMWNPKDKQDVTVLWRHPGPVDYDINSSKVYVDLHDVIRAGEFTPNRVDKITKIFVKTKFHRSLFPNVPDEKFEIVPNGMDFALFDQPIEKNQYLMVNTSSPDRSMDVLPKLFKKVKERVPEARLKWAYGWDIFDITFGQENYDKEKMAWKEQIIKDMEEAGIENLGRLPQAECAKLYLEGNLLAYPTEFAEIDCITVKKAQACGCMPITTDFGALGESVQYGVKIHSHKNKDNWCKDYQFHFGLDDEEAQNKWVDAAVEQLKKPLDTRTDMKKWAHRFEWPTVAGEWEVVFARQ